MKNRITQRLADSLFLQIKRCSDKVVFVHLPSQNGAFDVLARILELGKLQREGASDETLMATFNESITPEEKTTLRRMILNGFDATEALLDARSKGVTEAEIETARYGLAAMTRIIKRRIASEQADMRGPAEEALRELRAAITIATSDKTITREEALPKERHIQ